MPAFERPPVNEVALAVQFDRLLVGSVGLTRLASALETVEPGHKDIQEKLPEPPLTPPRSTGRSISLKVTGVPEPPLLWLLDKTQRYLIQLQADRLVVNWRKFTEEQKYPRYTSLVPRFEEAWKKLQIEANAQDLGEVKANACEVTYFNGIDVGREVPSIGEIQELVAPWSGKTSDDFLPTPLDIALTTRYRLPDKIGDLTIDLSPAHRIDRDQKAIVMRVSVLGRPRTSDLAGVLAFFNAAHDWIVRGFTSFTTTRMHELWGRIHDDD